MGFPTEHRHDAEPPLALTIAPALTDAQAEALVRALETEALRDARRPSGIDSMWRRAGLAEAVDRSPPRPDEGSG